MFITAKVLLASSVVMEMSTPRITRIASCTYKGINNLRFETLRQWMFCGKITLNFTSRDPGKGSGNEIRHFTIYWTLFEKRNR